MLHHWYQLWLSQTLQLGNVVSFELELHQVGHVQNGDGRFDLIVAEIEHTQTEKTALGQRSYIAQEVVT